MDTLIDVQNIKAYYKIGPHAYVRAVDDVSFSLKQGQIIGIAGESGCGKSTLVKVCTRSGKFPLTILGGKVIYNVNGEKIDIYAVEEERIRNLRWNFFAVVPQAAMNSLNPVMKLEQIFAETIGRGLRGERRKLKKIMHEVVEGMGLPAKILKMYSCQLSGGMKQRITIALAMIADPKVIYCDEPTSGLDLVTQKGILEFLKEKALEKEATLILVSHDMGIHAQMTDILIVLYAGKVVEIAPTVDAFGNPLHPYTRALINSLPILGDRTVRVGIPGVPPSLIEPLPCCRFHPRCPYAEVICREQEPPLREIRPGRLVACFFKDKIQGFGGGPLDRRCTPP